MKSFGERLKAFRKHTGLDQKEFAKRFGSDQGSVSHWEGGRNVPDLPTAISILKAFPDLNIFWLVDGEGEMIIMATSEKDSTNRDKIVADFYKKKYDALLEKALIQGLDIE
jgi:transcriptional regulator with XRE-family HTH domain